MVEGVAAVLRVVDSPSHLLRRSSPEGSLGLRMQGVSPHKRTCPPSRQAERSQSLQESVFKADSRTMRHWPSPAGTVHASVNPPIPLPLVAGTTLAFPSGEGGPLAVDEENTHIAALWGGDSPSPSAAPPPLPG